MNLNQKYYNQNENLSQAEFFTKCGQIWHYFSAVTKSAAEPENSNELHKANSSTPLNRAFFVRSLRTLKERAFLNLKARATFQNEINPLNIEPVQFLSMVAYGGKGFALCCVPCVAVSQPVIRYRPKPENFQAVTSTNSHKELSAMIYLFLGIRRQDLGDTRRTFKTLPKSRIAIFANSEQDARKRLAKSWCLLQSWTFKNQSEFDRTFAKGVIYA